LSDDKVGVRIDQNTGLGALFIYYFADDYLLDDSYPNSSVNVALPATGFAYRANTAGRAQLINLGLTRNLGSFSVNEFRFSYVRNALHLATPQGGVGSNYRLPNLGFVNPWNASTGGISPIIPALEGVRSLLSTISLLAYPRSPPDNTTTPFRGWTTFRR
jgi:hypothetical protein